ncbi:MAG: hypothetical protein ACOCR0_03520 [Haloferacaceae archaeon]
MSWTLYVCRDCRAASRGALLGVDDGVACSTCGSDRVETVDGGAA